MWRDASYFAEQAYNPEGLVVNTWTPTLLGHYTDVEDVTRVELYFELSTARRP